MRDKGNGTETYISLIDTDDLALWRGPELEARDHIDTLGNQSSDNECIRAGGGNVGDLLVEGFPVLVDPASLNADVDTVHRNDVGRTEEGVHDKSNNSTDRVLSEQIEGVVDADEVLD